MAKVSVWGMWNDLDIKARLKKEANMEEQKKCEVCGEKASLLAESLCAREHEEYHLCTSCHMVWKNEGVVPFKILRQLRQEMKDRVHYERVDELEEQIVAVRNTVSNMALNIKHYQKTLEMAMPQTGVTLPPEQQAQIQAAAGGPPQSQGGSQ